MAKAAREQLLGMGSRTQLLQSLGLQNDLLELLEKTSEKIGNQEQGVGEEAGGSHQETGGITSIDGDVDHGVSMSELVMAYSMLEAELGQRWNASPEEQVGRSGMVGGGVA
jgi:hypothetical protein